MEANEIHQDPGHIYIYTDKLILLIPAKIWLVMKFGLKRITFLDNNS